MAHPFYQKSGGLSITAKVAVVRFDEDKGSLNYALSLLGGIEDLNSAERPVVVKVGVFNHKAGNHTSVNVAEAIVKCFTKAPKIFVAESDNYMGTGSERLQIWKQIFTDRVVPFNLSEETDVRRIKVADEEIGLSHILFKPTVFVSTHILRTYERGSIIKNLLGLVPDKKKARFHKKLDTSLLDMYEAIGGIDLAVLDGTYLYHGLGSDPHIGPERNKYSSATGIVLVGRDAVAVETVGVFLAGLQPEKVPILQEAAKRGLGVADINNIEVVGAPLEDLKEEINAALKSFKKKTRTKGPQTWGGQLNHVFRELLQEGFFKPPNKRTISEVGKALEAKGLKTEGKEDKIEAALARKVKKGLLKSTQGPQERLYWSE